MSPSSFIVWTVSAFENLLSWGSVIILIPSNNLSKVSCYAIIVFTHNFNDLIHGLSCLWDICLVWFEWDFFLRIWLFKGCRCPPTLLTADRRTNWLTFWFLCLVDYWHDLSLNQLLLHLVYVEYSLLALLRIICCRSALSYSLALGRSMSFVIWNVPADTASVLKVSLSWVLNQCTDLFLLLLLFLFSVHRPLNIFLTDSLEWTKRHLRALSNLSPLLHSHAVLVWLRRITILRTICYSFLVQLKREINHTLFNRSQVSSVSLL